jgi:hypothetical protein
VEFCPAKLRGKVADFARLLNKTANLTCFYQFFSFLGIRVIIANKDWLPKPLRQNIFPCRFIYIEADVLNQPDQGEIKQWKR